MCQPPSNMLRLDGSATPPAFFLVALFIHCSQGHRLARALRTDIVYELFSMEKESPCAYWSQNSRREPASARVSCATTRTRAGHGVVVNDGTAPLCGRIGLIDKVIGKLTGMRSRAYWSTEY